MRATGIGAARVRLALTHATFSRSAGLRLVLPALLALLALGCAHAGPGTAPRTARAAKVRWVPTAPDADSITTALWHLEEKGGTRAADAGPFRIDATLGIDSKPDFGRFGVGRRFVHELDSFVYAPYNPTFDSVGGFTIEAWIFPTSFGDFEDTPIAARWTATANQHSWVLGLVGRKVDVAGVGNSSPGYQDDIVRDGSLGQLVFAFVPADAGGPRAFFSNRPIELNRWTHVAATVDGSVVRLYLDGLLDSQYATPGFIRASDAPLVIGNLLDPRNLSDFGGDLRVVDILDPKPYYAFEGIIDEVRLSSAARISFPSTGVR